MIARLATTLESSMTNGPASPTPRSPELRDDLLALLRAYRCGGDEAARERLVELAMPLVRVLAYRHANRGERIEDLVQVGSIGLLRAIDRFDPDRGDDFASFAVPTITGEIRHHLRDRAAVVRTPRRHAALQASRTAVSLSSPEEGDARLDRATAIHGTYDATEDRLLLVAGFRTLAARERRIMHLRFFAELSQGEIAREVGVSQVQVSRLIRASLERMRGALAVEVADRPAKQRPRGRV
jgi:RNA polymerase sigma-B factor